MLFESLVKKIEIESHLHCINIYGDPCTCGFLIQINEFLRLLLLARVPEINIV